MKNSMDCNNCKYLNITESEQRKKDSSVEIRLFNHKNGKVLYENLNMEQLDHILKVLNPKGWQ